MMLSCDAINSHPSKQAMANLIQCWVATNITPTYNTTNISNKLSSHQFTCNNICNETAQTFFFPCIFHCTHNDSLCYIEIIQMLKLFQSQYLLLNIFLPYFIIQTHSAMHIIDAWFPTQNWTIIASILHFNSMPYTSKYTL